MAETDNREQHEDGAGRQDSDADMDLGCAANVPPLVPVGEYSVVFSRASVGVFQKVGRTFLWFKIFTPGDHVGAELYLSCRHPADGRRHFGLGSKMVAAATIALGHLPKRRNRITTRIFREKVFRARVRTVVKDATGRARPRESQYSVIDSLLSLEAGRI